MSRLGLETVPGWRGTALATLQLEYDPSSAMGSLCHGVFLVLPVFAVSLILCWFWEALFAVVRNRRPVEGFLVTALLFTMLLPPEAPLWQAALGISFGTVLAKEVFGGTGKNFLNPALAGIAFLYFAYPNDLAGNPLWTGVAGYGGTTLFSNIHASGTQAIEQAGITARAAFLGLSQGSLSAASPAASLLGAFLLLRRRVASWRIMLGGFLGLLGTLFLLQFLAAEATSIFTIHWYWHLILGSFVFGIVFLATDPVTAAMTDPGRWIYGALIGFLVVLVRGANPAHPDGTVLAVLLGNVFAPMIDSFVVWTNVRRRQQRAR
jgi:Na+-transporting NADH:ubiquinone oxidoreductase subunit B